MGRFINGINGPVTGRVGTIIGSSRNGVAYVKGPYKKRTKRISKKEKANRDRFAMAQLWLQPILGFLRQGFKNYSERSEGFVAAKSWLLKNSFEEDGTAIRINPALVKVSFGDLPVANNITVSQPSPGQLKFTWDVSIVEGASPSDQVMLLAYDIENSQASFTITGQFRNTGSDILPVPRTRKRTYHLYAAFVASDRERQSHSVYLGEWNV
ncbi:MAG: DUF6266 family protein [Bacteroidota bacterium]|nr:DUF6266 family protein [Bacteroidota bacterium]